MALFDTIFDRSNLTNTDLFASTGLARKGNENKRQLDALHDVKPRKKTRRSLDGEFEEVTPTSVLKASSPKKSKKKSLEGSEPESKDATQLKEPKKSKKLGRSSKKQDLQAGGVVPLKKASKAKKSVQDPDKAPDEGQGSAETTSAASESKKKTKQKKLKKLVEKATEPAPGHESGTAGKSAAESIDQEEAVNDAMLDNSDHVSGVDAPQATGRSLEEEAEVLSRTVFVGNLPAIQNKKPLLNLFSKYGKVKSLRFRSVPLKLDEKKILPRRAAILSQKVSEDRGSAHAYIVFQTAASAIASLELNMHELNGRHLRVDMASQSRSAGGQAAQYTKAQTIFVGNLPFDVADEELIQVFNEQTEGKNSVVAVRVVRDKENNLGKGIAYVMFGEKTAARMALAKDGTLIRKRPIRVTNVSSAGQISASSKPQKTSSLGRYKAVGALGRLERKFGSLPDQKKKTNVASWQGTRTKGAKKISRPAAATSKPAASGAAKQKSAPGASGAKKKRPAVAARKAKQLGKPAPKESKKRK